MGSFLKNLKYLEEEILINNKKEYSKKTKEVLQSLVCYIESGVGIKSETSRFYMANFRLKNKELCKVWNINHGDKPKNESTVRSQLSTLNTKLAILYGNDIIDIFLNQNEDGLNRIRDIIYAFKLSEKFTTENLFSKKLFPSDFKYSGQAFDIKDCKKELQILVKSSDVYLNELLKDVDLDKLYFIRQVLDEEVIDSSYESLNKIKLQFLKGVSQSVAELRNPQKLRNFNNSKNDSEDESKPKDTTENDKEKSKNYELNSRLISTSSLIDKLSKFADNGQEVINDNLLSENQQRNILQIMLSTTNDSTLQNLLSRLSPDIVRQMLDEYQQNNN